MTEDEREMADLVADLAAHFARLFWEQPSGPMMNYTSTWVEPEPDVVVVCDSE